MDGLALEVGDPMTGNEIAVRKAHAVPLVLLLWMIDIDHGVWGHAEIGGLDGAEVLLVGLGVCRVLVEQIGCAGLDLADEDLGPQLLGGHGLAGLALGLVTGIQSIEGLAVDIGQAWGLVGAEETPLTVGLHAAHEEIGDPQRVEQIAGLLLLGARVRLHAQKGLDIGVPGLQIDGEGAVATPALVDVAGRVVEHAEHGHQAVGAPVRAGDVRAGCADIVDRKTDAAGILGDLGAVLEGVEDAVDAVVLHGHEVAAGELGALGGGIEESGGGVREGLAAHEIVGLLNSGEGRGAVNADGDTQPHILGRLCQTRGRSHEIAALERLEAEVVEQKVTAGVDHGVQSGRVIRDVGTDLCIQRVQRRHSGTEGGGSRTLCVAQNNAARQGRPIWMGGNVRD